MILTIPRTVHTSHGAEALQSLQQCGLPLKGATDEDANGTRVCPGMMHDAARNHPGQGTSTSEFIEGCMTDVSTMPYDVEGNTTRGKVKATSSLGSPGPVPSPVPGHAGLGDTAFAKPGDQRRTSYVQTAARSQSSSHNNIFAHPSAKCRALVRRSRCTVVFGHESTQPETATYPFTRSVTDLTSALPLNMRACADRAHIGRR